MGCGSCRNARNPGMMTMSLNALRVNRENFVMKNALPFLEVYKVGKTLGTSSTGEVRQAFLRTTNETRAIKLYKKTQTASAVTISKMAQEVDILRSLDHPNIIKVYEYFEDNKSFIIVMEQCNGGELFEEIVKRQRFGEHHTAFIAYQLLSALVYLHENGIVHRDIKPENILLEDKGEEFNIKLVDFGIAVRIESSQSVLKDPIGSVYYIAPEVLAGSYNQLCDLWSVGVIVYILLSGLPPFMGKSDLEIVEKIKKIAYDFEGSIWNRVSQEAKEFISLLLTPASTRITAKAALEHKWIKANSTSKSLSSEKTDAILNNLSSFYQGSKLREAVNTFISSHCVSKSETADLKKAFIAMDKNGDGKLSKEELIKFYTKNLGLEAAEAEVEKIMKSVDADNSGYIDYTEFIKASLNSKVINNSSYLKRAFDLFDTDGSGTISISELKAVMAGGSICDEGIWKELMQSADSNGDNHIDFNEFQAILEKSN